MNRDRVPPLQIANAARLIVDFSQDLGCEGFFDNALIQSAVLYQFTVSGEAVNQRSPAILDQHTEVPWTAIACMRDRLIHGYDVVNLEMVWDTIDQDVPALLYHITPYLHREE